MSSSNTQETEKKERVLHIQSPYPKKSVRINGLTITYCKFECSIEKLYDKDNFNFLALMLMGSSEKPAEFGPKKLKLDSAELLVEIGLAYNLEEAKKLIKRKIVGMGEPDNIKSIPKKLVIKDPYHIMLTFNRAKGDWVFVVFGE